MSRQTSGFSLVVSISYNTRNKMLVAAAATAIRSEIEKYVVEFGPRVSSDAIREDLGRRLATLCGNSATAPPLPRTAIAVETPREYMCLIVLNLPVSEFMQKAPRPLLEPVLSSVKDWTFYPVPTDAALKLCPMSVYRIRGKEAMSKIHSTTQHDEKGPFRYFFVPNLALEQKLSAEADQLATAHILNTLSRVVRYGKHTRPRRRARTARAATNPTARAQLPLPLPVPARTPCGTCGLTTDEFYFTSCLCT